MEVCVDNVQSAINAATGGASRIELCSALSEGGLTPSVGFLRTIKQLIPIPVFVMLRPRRGNFVYNDHELEVMKQDAISLKEAGADGVVFGILNSDGTINEPACQLILRFVHPLPATFHRAFDVIRDPINSLESLIDIGFRRLLTSGQRARAEDGIDLITKLVVKADGRIIIMPGAGINVSNVSRIMATGVREIHASARLPVKLEFQGGTRLSMGNVDDNELLVTDMECVRDIVAAMNSSAKAL